jgi:hypothetical protein
MHGCPSRLPVSVRAKSGDVNHSFRCNQIVVITKPLSAVSLPDLNDVPAGISDSSPAQRAYLKSS